MGEGGCASFFPPLLIPCHDCQVDEEEYKKRSGLVGRRTRQQPPSGMRPVEREPIPIRNKKGESVRYYVFRYTIRFLGPALSRLRNNFQGMNEIL